MADTEQVLTRAINKAYLADEADTVRFLKQQLFHDRDISSSVETFALKLVRSVRSRGPGGGLNAFMREYDLSSKEGVLLLCLAEALLRIPDTKTADQLIKDKLLKANWMEHLRDDQSLFVNAGTWGLMLTGKLIELEERQVSDPVGFLGGLMGRLSEPVVRMAMKEAMKIISQQFVMGDCIDRALQRATGQEYKDDLFSFDMLGEAAVCQEDADRFFQQYQQAIEKVAGISQAQKPIHCAPSVSIKLSALHPRYEISQAQSVFAQLQARLEQLALMAKEAHVALTIDAEEAHRLDLMLDLFRALLFHPQLKGWNGLGLAVQAYQKRAYPVIQWLDYVAQKAGCKVPVRLVKGAYWDSEIKWAQEQGLQHYPVFSRKHYTDVSYLSCAQLLLRSEHLYAQFATHNAHTLASVSAYARHWGKDFETQRLHGMGEELYQAYGKDQEVALRIYAPVGEHQELLPYLVRRLLENGANTSFINHISDPTVPESTLVQDPAVQVERESQFSPGVPLPADIFPGRVNSAGVNLADKEIRDHYSRLLQEHRQYKARELSSLLQGCQVESYESVLSLNNPANSDHLISHVAIAQDSLIDQAFGLAAQAYESWNHQSVESRACCLETMAGLMEQESNRDELISALVLEGGKCLADAVAELREAVDFCRYYAAQLRQLHTPLELPGVTGESNTLYLQGRGVFLCISPWNFPLAIFVGQVAAALAAGNAVVAKPSAQTPLSAYLAVRLFHKAGIPPSALNLLLISGARIEQVALVHPLLAGVAFTGSTETARKIQGALAARGGGIIPLVAETGGINAMIVDSSALAQQVVNDVIASAFNSAGQRCSALRVLFIQKDVADRVIELLIGAMKELKQGDPSNLSVDMGPVIDVRAQRELSDYIKTASKTAKHLFSRDLTPECANGHFVPPSLFEIQSLEQLSREIFGPVLHIIRYSQETLAQTIDHINASHYGLTLGLHSRLESSMALVRRKARVGNIYVNRNMIGATVGAQPFGGEALSGTGPKAGGPHYLLAFSTERVFTVNTAAIGGNTQLLSNT